MRRYRSTVSVNGVKFIAAFEGLRLDPYRDAVNVWTIGYGHTKGVTGQTKRLTVAQAERLLLDDINREYAPAVAKALEACKLRTTQGEFNALVSLAFNLGTGIVGPGHTIGVAIMRRNRSEIANSFLLYDKAGGHALAGLTRRRKAERLLFLTGKYPR